MPFHYTKNTVSATVRCPKCGKPTEHSVFDGRLGACLACLRKPSEPKPAAPPERQGSLFGKPG